MDLQTLKTRLHRAYTAFRRADEPIVADTFAITDARVEPPFLPVTPALVERWNKEWLRYLAREWERQLEPYTTAGEKPPLPAEPRALIDLKLGGTPLSLYCDREWIENKRVVEIGCGCGNLGKHLARYTESYLGIDYSTLALKIARLVSPPNATYVHAGDRPGLRDWFGKIDTAVGRFFWIHQNFELGGPLLDLIGALLVPRGRVYADFFHLDPGAKEKVVPRSPRDPLSAMHPSAVFAYTLEDVRMLIGSRPFQILREEIHLPMQRRYVVLEKLG